MYSDIKKIIKALAKKARGLDRKAKIEKMLYGLTALALWHCRQRRAGNLIFIDFADIVKVEGILKRAQAVRI